MSCIHSYDMNQILLQRRGPIHELIINLPDDCLELDQIILQLSRNHPIKKLTLLGCHSDACCTLPKSTFSFHHVTHMDLHYVDFEDVPKFNGFGSLVSLFLRYVGISKKDLLRLLSKCPSLKSLSLFVENILIDCTINELFECLPAVEHLTTWPLVVEWLVLEPIPQELPTSLNHLKYFCFGEMNLLGGRELAFLLVLIKCSPNLEKIKIEYDFSSYEYDEEYVLVWEEYSDVWLEHLTELEITYFDNTKLEMEFVKFILARSPKLKRVSIYSVVNEKQESKMLKTLLQAPRVSPVVITIESSYERVVEEVYDI